MRQTRLGAMLSSSDVFAVSAGQFGVDPDLPDNSEQLFRLRQWLLNQNTFPIVTFPPGLIRYTNNGWLAGVQRCHLLGQDTALQCTGTGSLSSDRRPLDNGTPFQTADRSVLDFGRRIDSCSKGDFAIVLSSPADSGYVIPGDRLLIYGFDQQFSGFPPNARYFQYCRAISVIGQSIGLARPLRHDFDNDWFDSPNFGKPRIINLDRCHIPFAKSICLENITLLQGSENPTSGTAYALLSGERVEFLNCNCEHLIPTICDRFVASGGVVNGMLEVDKLINSALVDRVTINGQTAAATGCNLFQMQNCVCHDYIHVSPRVLQLRGNQVYAKGTAGEAIREFSAFGYASAYADIEDNVISLSSEFNAIGFQIRPSLTVNGVIGTSIAIDDTPPNRTAIIRRVMPGTFLEGSVKSGTVTRVWHNGGQWVIDWTGPEPVAGETYSWYVTHHVTQSGNVVDSACGGFASR